MTFKECETEEYEYLLYESFIIGLALHKQKPIKAVQYDCDKKTQCIVIFRESPNGNISTKRLTANKGAMVFIRTWLAQDFPSLEFEVVESSEDVEE